MGASGEEQFKKSISPQDRELIERARSADADAICELLFNRCGRAIAHLVRRFSYSDLWGELYVALNQDDWRKLTQWRGGCSLESWVWKVAISLCIAKVRREKRIVSLEPESLLHTFTANDDFDAPLRRRDLLRAIDSLKDPRQRVILSATLRNEPLEQIAATLRITRNHADQLKSRAIDQVKKILEERGRGQNA